MPAVSRAARTDCDELYRRHAAGIYRYVYGALGNRADAEDLTQQTFLNAYRAISRGTDPLKAEHWLRAIAHNEIRRYFRRSYTQPLEVRLDEDVADSPTEPGDPSLDDVVRGLQQLPPVQRSALVMRELEGRSYAEIAEILDVTEAALETLMFRARRGLAEVLYGELTCTDAEDALTREPHRKLLGRESRRLSAHMRKCAECKRFAQARKRAGSLLSGLTLLPFPASGLGASAAATGGSAAVTGGGVTAVGSAFALKAAAVTAAIGVAGGVGYTATTRDQEVRAAPEVTHVVAAAKDRNHRIVATGMTTRRRAARVSNGRITRKPKAVRERTHTRLPRVKQVTKARKTDRPRRNAPRKFAKAASVRHAERAKLKPKHSRTRTVGKKAVHRARKHGKQTHAARASGKTKSLPDAKPAAELPQPQRHGPKN